MDAQLINIWFDDIRPAPPGWEWARTVEQAIELFGTHEVNGISLDNDLGFALVEIDESDLPTDPEELIEFIFNLQQIDQHYDREGIELVDWMIETGNVPPVIRIHSWNLARAKEMHLRFRDHGHHSWIDVYKPEWRDPDGGMTLPDAG